MAWDCGARNACGLHSSYLPACWTRKDRALCSVCMKKDPPLGVGGGGERVCGSMAHRILLIFSHTLSFQCTVYLPAELPASLFSYRSLPCLQKIRWRGAAGRRPSPATRQCLARLHPRRRYDLTCPCMMPLICLTGAFFSCLVAVCSPWRHPCGSWARWRTAGLAGGMPGFDVEMAGRCICSWQVFL